MCENRKLFLVTINHNKNVNKVLRCIVFRVVYHFSGKLSCKVTDIRLLLLLFRTNFDERIVFDLILIFKKLEEAAYVLRS